MRLENAIASEEDLVVLPSHIPLPRPMILTFHDIVRGKSCGLYKIGVGLFEKHLKVIQGLASATGKDHSTIQVTFDDGHVSNYELALPLLERYGIRATFFVTAGLTGINPGYMRWSQLKELVALGHDVQSHTWSHPVLTNCPEPTLIEELQRSKETLEDRLMLSVRKIAIPYGRYSNRVFKACAATGYETVYVGDPWMRPRRHSGVRIFGRLSVPSTWTDFALGAFLTAKTLPFLSRRARSEVKHRLRLLIGENFYRSICRRVFRGVAMLAAVYQVWNMTVFLT